MGKAAILAVTALIIAGSYFNLATLDGEAGTARVESTYQHRVLARNAALAGYEQAKQVLTDAGSFRPFASSDVTIEGHYDGVRYETEISSDGETAAIHSVGTATAGSRDVVFAVDAVVGLAAGPAENVPPFLTYALLAQEDLDLNGNVNAYVDDPGADHNANFHTNGDLHVNGNAALVEGFGSFAGAGTSNPPSALANTFQPHFNPDELETAYQAPAVDIPPFDAAGFLGDVEVDRFTAGDAQIPAPIFVGGTREDPFVWHVTGNLTGVGTATVIGYVMFVVEGDITLSGNLAVGSIGDESTVALYAGGDVSVSGNVDVNGQIFAGGDVILSGTPDIYGSITTGEDAVLNGTPGIHYRPASPALTTIFPDENVLVLLSYYEQ